MYTTKIIQIKKMVLEMSRRNIHVSHQHDKLNYVFVVL